MPSNFLGLVPASIPDRELVAGLREAVDRQPASEVLRAWLDLASGEVDFFTSLIRLKKSPRLSYLTVDTTAACDLVCPGMCYYHPGIDPRRPLVAEETLRLAIGDATRELDLQNLVFAGKEPLLNPHRLLSLLRFAAAIPNRNFAIGIVTNGRHIARHWEGLTSLAQQRGLSFLDISIDSGIAKQHDEIRGATGTFDLAISALERCTRQWTSVRVSASSVLRHDNSSGILELYRRTASVCRHFFVTPIQPPPFTSTPPLAWSEIKLFLDDLSDLLRTELADAGLEVMISLLGIYLYDAVRDGFFSWSDLREDAQGQCFAIQEIAGNRLIMHTMVLPETGWRIARITSTGAYLPNSHFLQDPNPDRFAVGFLQEETLLGLYRKATSQASILHRMFLSREGHACRTRPCWGNCFGGLTVAENAFLSDRILTAQPSICLKTDTPT